MYGAVGVHYPVTKAVIKQYFEICKQGSKISYKKIGEDVVKKLDTSVQNYKENFEKKREQERGKETKVELQDDGVIEDLI